MWSAVRRADLRGRISCERRRGVLWDNKVFRHARARGQWAREHLYSSALCSRHIRSAFRESRTRLWTDGRRVSAGGEGQQRGAAARSAGADRGGAAAVAASRASLRACPCLDDVERAQKIHLLPASTPTSPWHHNRCQHFLTFCPTHSVYPRVSEYALPCSADAFPLVLELFARTSGSVPLGIRCRWYFYHMRGTGLDRLTRCSPRNELGSRLLLVH